MPNKIPCSAERLGLLDPQMIQAVSEASAFQIAQQYLTENRVRIVEADDSQITSAVIGNSGLYEQNIRLKDGHLVSKCSCSLPEEPMCRHCIAVLLEYHRWAQRKQPRKPAPNKEAKTLPQVEPLGNGKASAISSFVADVKLSEIMQFVEWLQSATHALEKHERLPEPPNLIPGEVSTWVQTIRTIEERRRESEEDLRRVKTEIRDRDTHLRLLTQQLQTSMAEMKTAQKASQEHQRELARYKSILARVSELTVEVVRYDEEMRAAAREMLQKSSQFDQLTGSFKQVAEALKAAVELTPQQQ